MAAGAFPAGPVHALLREMAPPYPFAGIKTEWPTLFEKPPSAAALHYLTSATISEPAKIDRALALLEVLQASDGASFATVQHPFKVGNLETDGGLDFKTLLHAHATNVWWTAALAEVKAKGTFKTKVVMQALCSAHRHHVAAGEWGGDLSLRPASMRPEVLAAINLAMIAATVENGLLQTGNTDNKYAAAAVMATLASGTVKGWAERYRDSIRVEAALTFHDPRTRQPMSAIHAQALLQLFAGTLTKAASDRLRLAVALNGTMTDYNKDALLANPDGVTSFLGPAVDALVAAHQPPPKQRIDHFQFQPRCPP